jgi:hypothetical protein
MKSRAAREFEQNRIFDPQQLPPKAQWHPKLVAGRPRVWAVLMLMLVLALALFTNIFRCGGRCGWTTGERAHSGAAQQVCGDFASR